MQRKCEQCGREFNAKPYDVRRGFGRYCSRYCGRFGLRKNGKADAWRYFRKSDGRWYRKWREPGSRKLCQQLEHRWVWEQSHGPIPEGHEIHHIDGDQSNNDPGNLECVTAEWHDNHHARLRENHRIIDGIEHRRCQRCEEYKTLDQFSRRSAGTYHGYCKPCGVEYVREWRRANSEHVRAYKRDYRKRTGID